jgi:integrase
LGSAQLETLQAACRADTDLHIALAILICTGARARAVTELTWDRIDCEGRSIDFRNPHDPKASRRKPRAVAAIPAKLVRLLQRHRKRSTGPRVLPWGYDMLRRRLAAASEAAGLERVTPHILRHTVATHLLRHVSLVIASQQIGHQTTTTTEQEYRHLKVSDLAPAAEALGLLLR